MTSSSAPTGTRLPTDDYLAHIGAESARFAEVLAACAPDAPVPSCPEWSAADLLWHLVGVQDWWTWCVEQRPRSAQEGYPEPERPDGEGAYAALLERFGAGTTRLVDALAAADPAEEAWTWKADDHTVGFIVRRQAHEALIHRVDAELAAGAPSPLHPLLATDGVEEVLDVMFGGAPPAWGSWQPLETFVRVDATDTDTAVWVQLGDFVGTHPESGTVHDGPDLHVVPDPGREPDCVVEGTAEDLVTWLWRRRDDAGISVAGDRAAYDHFRAASDHAIT